MNNSSGQSSLQLVFPLLLILLVTFSLAFFMPTMSAGKTLAVAAGIILFMVSFVSSQIALYILIFSMLLSPEIIIGETGGASLGRGITLRLDDFILLIIGFGWLARMAIHKELGFFLKTPLNKPIGFYIVASLIATLLGALMGRVDLKTGFLFVLKYFQYIIIYFMVVNHVQEKKQIHHFLWALLIACVIVSILGIAQIPGGERVSAPFEGENGEPNTLGGYLILMMAITMGLFLTTHAWRDRIIYGGISILAFIPFLFTESRASYLGFFPILLVFAWLSEKRKLIIIGILFLAILLPTVSPRVVKERIRYTFTQQAQSDQIQIANIKLDTSTSARLKSWQDALKDTAKHPVFGFGVTGYKFVDAQYPRILVETGIIGLFTFMLLLFAILKYGLTVFRGTSDVLYRGLSMGFLVGFVGLLFHATGANTFIIVRIMEPFWFVLGMVAVIPELETQSPVERPRVESEEQIA